MNNNASMNRDIQISVSVSASNTFEYKPRAEIAGYYDNSMFIFF